MAAPNSTQRSQLCFLVWFLEGLLAAELGIIWKEHHGGPFEIRQCSRILSNVDFLELYVRNLEFKQESADGRAIEASHLLFKQPEVRLNADPILNCLLLIEFVEAAAVK